LSTYWVVSELTLPPDIGWHFKEDVLRLLRRVLTASYSSFNGQFKGHIDGVAMGLLLSLVIANLYMEGFERAALDPAPNNPSSGFAAWTMPSSSGHMVLIS
jgi:hypothetical protein